MSEISGTLQVLLYSFQEQVILLGERASSPGRENNLLDYLVAIHSLNEASELRTYAVAFTG